MVRNSRNLKQCKAVLVADEKWRERRQNPVGLGHALLTHTITPPASLGGKLIILRKILICSLKKSNLGLTRIQNELSRPSPEC